MKNVIFDDLQEQVKKVFLLFHHVLPLQFFQFLPIETLNDPLDYYFYKIQTHDRQP